jgi:hypothetical protein
MSEADHVAAVLAQVVEVGSGTPAQELELKAAVSQHITERPAPITRQPDSDAVAALRSGHCPTCGQLINGYQP